MSGGNAICSKYVFIFVYKSGYSFRRFNCCRELIPDCWLSYKESMFVNIELCIKNKMLFGNWKQMI